MSHGVTDTASLLQVLEHTRGVTLAVLFGSAARDPKAVVRDVDIGVLFEDDSTRRALADSLLVELERACGLTVDLVSLADAPPLLRLEIARDGVLLVERVPFAWHDFRVRAMRDWWDWAPIARRGYATAARRVQQAAATPPQSATTEDPATLAASSSTNLGG